MKILISVLTLLFGQCSYAYAEAEQVDVLDFSSTFTESLSLFEQERRLLQEIHDTNLMEIRAGELAMSKGFASSVRAYGERLKKDHLFTDKRILDFAVKHDMPLATSPEMKMEKLEAATGTAFDGAFLDMMEDGHQEKIVKLSQAYDGLATDSGIRWLVGRIIPILKQHREIAIEIKGQ